MAVNLLDMPVRRPEAHRLIIGDGQAGGPVDRDRVVVEEGDQLAQLQVAPPQHLKDLAAALLQGLRLLHLAPLQSSSWQRGLRAELLPQHPGGQQPAGTAALPAA